MGIYKTSAKKAHYTKNEFSVKYLFSKFNQIHNKMWILSHLLKNL